jgi:tetraacyldisaccharide 4'-kinase
MHAPEFWLTDGVAPRLLAPAAAIWAAAARYRQRHAKRVRAAVPIICVGNLVAGGQGKTPVALAIAAELTAQGAAPWFLTRGYGGSQKGPLLVSRHSHDATEVGDEALLLDQAAPTIVARDRPAGAAFAAHGGASVIIMDDGFQNPSLVKDLSLVVIDGFYGFGNGRVMPAGPLREAVVDGLARAQAVVIVGEDRHGLSRRLPGSCPVLAADLSVRGDNDLWRGRRVVAFAGIGRPAKFFDTLAGLGADLVVARSFADHHRYEPHVIQQLAAEAQRLDAHLVTTSKDAVRLAPPERALVSVLAVDLVWRDPAAIRSLLAGLAQR